MQRRSFLQLAGGAALTAALPESGPATERPARAPIRPAIYSGIDKAIPFLDLVPQIRAAGFEVLALSDPKHNGYDTPAGRGVIRRLLDQHGMTLDSIHAPFPEGDRLFALDEVARQESIRQCKIAIEAAAELDGPIVVVHLIQPYGIPHDEARDRMIVCGKESLRILVDHAAERDVKLALENGQRRDYDEVLQDCLAELPAETVGFCYDSGHENVQGTGFQMLERNTARLLTLHIHDNRGTDTHQLPHEGNIAWDEFRRVFQRLDYRGNFPLEVVAKGSPFPELKVFLAEAYQRAKRLLAPLAVLAGLLASSAGDASATEHGPKPNLVLVLIDDLGWSDLGCYGSGFHETPSLDRLAGAGMRFTEAYAACNACSPTRAALLTGKYPARLHLTDWIPGTTFRHARLLPPAWTPSLRLEEFTIAEALAAHGYATAAIGKWHLGKPPSLPQNQGFDVNIAGNHGGAPGSYFWPYAHGDPARADRYHGGPVPDVLAGGQPGEYLTDRLTDEALRFITANRERPFFLYLAHYAVHMPLQARPDLEAKYRARARPDTADCNPTYAAMIESVDQGIGRLVAQLDALGLGDQTVVLVTSDNGGYLGATANRPLRGGKGQPWEGGIRVPLIVRWPGVVPAGSVCHEPVSSVDFYPTILEIAGAAGEPQHNSQVDGVSLLPLLKRQGRLRRETLFWHYPHYNALAGRPHGIVRQGAYKLIESYEDGNLELYDLHRDLGEETNLAMALPDTAAALQDTLHRWRAAIGAQMPVPNPNHDPAHPGP